MNKIYRLALGISCLFLAVAIFGSSCSTHPEKTAKALFDSKSSSATEMSESTSIISSKEDANSLSDSIYSSTGSSSETSEPKQKENSISGSLAIPARKESEAAESTATKALSATATVSNYTELNAAIQNPVNEVIQIANSILLDGPIEIGRSIVFTADNDVTLTSAANQRHFTIFNPSLSLSLSFTNITLDGNNHLGGIESTASNLSITGGQFFECENNNIGGAILCDGNLTLNSCVFIGNSSVTEGGGLHLSNQNSSSVFQNCLFESNSSTEGGAIGGYGTLLLDNCIFQLNTASSQGGAISILGSTTITRCQILNNSSATYGGAVIADNLMVEKSLVSGNSTGNAGGALYVNKLLELQSTQLLNNQAIFGGAVFGEEQVNITGCLISKNTAFSGSGITINGFGQKYLVIENSHITENSADGYGAAIDISKTNVTISGCKINDNISEYGGAGIMAGYDSVLNISASELMRNHSNINGETYTTYGGGAIYMYSASLTIADSTIANNSSGSDGGGIYAEGNPGYTIELNGTRLFGNVAAENGGAVCATELGSISADAGTSFGDNLARLAYHATDPDDIALHESKILTRSFSLAPAGAQAFLVAYNNFDISYQNGTPLLFYTITFNAMNGDSALVQTVLQGATAKTPSPPEKAGSRFIEWNTQQDGSGLVWDFGTMPVNENTNLYAQYGILEHTVTFDAMGGSPVPSQLLPAGSVVPRPDEPAKTGYTFTAWYQDSSYTRLWDFKSDVISGDLTLFAKWTRQGTVSSIPIKVPVSSSSPASIAQPSPSSGVTVPSASSASRVTSTPVPSRPTSSLSAPISSSGSASQTALSSSSSSPSETYTGGTSSSIANSSSSQDYFTYSSMPPQTLRKQAIKQLTEEGVRTFSIGDHTIFLYGRNAPVWSLFNLLMMLAAIGLAGRAGLSIYKKHQNQTASRPSVQEVLPLALGALSVLLFLLVSRLLGLMVIFNIWSIVFFAIVCAQIVLLVLEKKQSE